LKTEFGLWLTEFAHTSQAEYFNSCRINSLHKEHYDMATKQSFLMDELPVTGYVRQSQLIPKILPFSSATLWRMVNVNKFPRPVKLSERVTAWRVEEIREWMLSLPTSGKGA
jgi:prophage regulatory protein